MIRKINNWHLSIMIVIVSIISLAFIENNVLAQWQDPSSLPGDSSNQVFFNPALGDLDLGGYTIVDSSQAGFVIDPGGVYGIRIGGSGYAGWFDGDVNIDGTLTIDGLPVEGGADEFIDLIDTPNTYEGQAGKFIMVNQDENGLQFVDFVGPTGLWTDNGANIFRESNVAIGKNSPSVLLDIKADTGHNAEIDIQSGNNNFWRIYNDESSNDLRFYATGTGDVVILKNTGEFLLGTSTAHADLTIAGDAFFSSSNAVTLYAFNSAATGIGIYAEGQDAIKGYSTVANGKGVFGESSLSNGVEGVGPVGVYGESNTSGAGAYGVYGVGGAGAFGGWFESNASSSAGVKGETSAGIAGVWGIGTEVTNVGVRGEGKYGVYGLPNVAGGAGIFGQGSSTADAAYFEGDVVIAPLGSADSFFQLDTYAGTPPSGDCDSSHKGRMIFDTSSNKLWVCSDVWRSTTLTP